MKKSFILFLVVNSIWCCHLSALAMNCPDFESCMMEQMKTASDSQTLGQLKAGCRACVEETARKEPASDEKSALDKRIEAEHASVDDRFVLTPHRPNYLIPVSYNFSPNPEPFDAEDEDIDRAEVKFQFSFKYKLLDDLIFNNGDVYVAYTNKSYWQAYNKDISSPFRETNHEPEAWIGFGTDWKFFGIESKIITFGISHQSNGQSGTLSRSWNRLYMDFIFEKGDFYLSFKPWYRIPEDDEDDDNPDIDDYLGHGELRMGYDWNDQLFSLMLRNNLKTSGNRGCAELGWSFPLYKKLKGYLQLFHGYGDSLLDYNDSATRVGFGMMLSDWL